MRWNKGKGFTLIELLAVIAITGLVFGLTGTFVYNIITNSKNRSIVLAEDNIKKTASVYTEEYSNDVAWIQNIDNEKTSYTCIDINSLVDKGYLKESDIQKEYLGKYVSLTKDKNETIIDMYFSSDKKCDANGKSKVSIPTASEYCNNLSYSGNRQVLTKSSNEGFEFGENNFGIDAGNYVIEAKINDGYIWTDNSEEVKKITCSIKKAVPILSFSKSTSSDNSNGEGGTDLNDTILSLNSSVDGVISIKTSNKDVASASIDRNQIKVGVSNNITIKKYATKKSNTYITFSLVPNDVKNYEKASIIYTIGEVSRKKVKKPVCNDLYYNGTSQQLVNNNAAYILVNNVAQEIGSTYKVTAKLAYGYVWSDTASGSDYELTCAIKRPTPVVTYDNNGGVGCSSTMVNYGTYYGNLCVPTKTGHDFLGWYTSPDGGNKIENNTTVTNFRNHTIYAHWQVNSYTVDVNPVINGITYNSGVDGFTFNVYLNGNLVSSNVKDYCQSIPYGTKVEVKTNAVTGYTTKGASLTVVANDNYLSPTWNVNSYTVDVNPVINGTTYKSGVDGFTFNVYLNDTLVSSNVKDYYNTSVPYGTKVEVKTNAIDKYDNSNASGYVGIGGLVLSPTWNGKWYSWTASFSYEVSATQNLSNLGTKNINSSITCNWQYPNSSCTPETKTPDVYFPKNNSKERSLGEAFSYNWKSASGEVGVNSSITLTGNVDYKLNMWANFSGKVFKSLNVKGSVNSWVMDSNVLENGRQDSQRIGFILAGNIAYLNGTWGIAKNGNDRECVWVQGNGTGKRCTNKGDATRLKCNSYKKCSGSTEKCRVPTSGNGYICLNTLTW